MMSGLLTFAQSADRRLAEHNELTADKPLFHYTNAKGLRGILLRRSLWASDVKCVNDTRELEHGLELMRSVDLPNESTRLLVERALNHPNFSTVVVFVASFSEKPDMLSQWRAYGGDGAGYALGFRASSLTSIVPKEWRPGAPCLLMKVIYDEDRQRVLANRIMSDVCDWFTSVGVDHIAEADVALAALGLASVLPTFAAACKGRAFDEEAEWRLVARFTPAYLTEGNGVASMPRASFRIGRYGLTPYVTLPLPAVGSVRDIVLGPKLSSPDQGARVRTLLSNASLTDWAAVEVRRSSASYR